MMRRLTAAAACALATIGVATSARAQQKGSIALDQFDPAPAGDAFFGVPSPYARGDLVPRGLVLFDFADKPMRLDQASGTAEVVAQQAFLHLDASFTIQDRLLVSVLLPVALSQGGDNPDVGGQMLSSPKAAEIGDLRLGLRVRMFGADDDPIQLGVGAYLHLPTAKSGGFAGEGTTREAPHLAAGGRLKLGVPFVWAASVGVLVRSSENPSMLTYGAGFAASLLHDRLHLGVETYAATPLQDGTFAISDTVKVPANQTTNAELLGEVRARLLGALVIGAAAGPGLSQAIGTPAFRFTGGLGWSPEPAPKEASSGDADGDGIPDAEDACPYAFGPKSAVASRNGCPLVDDDEDGIPNFEDACPDRYGPKNADPAKNGCPPPAPLDVDGDGIPDAEDACPNEKGVPSRDKSKNGCPATEVDSDGDGIPDADDACPREKGRRTTDAATSGCPVHARVTATEISVLTPLAWKAKAPKPALEASADAPLADVQSVLADHPEIVKIEIQSHSGDKGVGKLNETTTQLRADAVKAWLVAHGVAAEKLVARGYGATKPIADDKTPEGRAKNERVTFVIVERK